MRCKKLGLLASVLLASSVVFPAENEIRPQSPVVCENFSNPLGYDISTLTFSWKLPNDRKGLKQTAYRIVTAATKEGLEDKHLWDTGRVTSAQNRNIAYTGDMVKSRERIWWKVLFWDENGIASEWSEPQWFEAGLQTTLEWSAKWISSADKPVEVVKKFSYGKNKGEIKRQFVAPAYLRKVFQLQAKPIKSARLYVASHGWYQAYINGAKVGDDYLGTGWTVYPKHTQSQTYDVTAMLNEGANAIGATITDGWYSGYMGWTKGYPYGVKPEILMQLEVAYEDGSTQVVASDLTWKYSKGPVLFADIYDGETYDARLAMPGWNEADFDDASWRLVDARDISKSEKVLPRRDRPVRKMMTLKPLDVKERAPGVFQFDVGQNIVGWVKIRVPSSPGRKITINFAEMLNKDGTLYNENYRSAKSEDSFTGSSFGVEEWEPNFTFHGFRYVELSGFPPNTKPSVDMVEAVVLHTDMDMAGTFLCSHPKVNTLQSNIQWGQRGNFLSIPTDCPQRDERLGWTGDAQIFCPTAAFNMDVSAFFSKWLLDVRNSQTAEGLVPDVVPCFEKHKWLENAHAAWGDAAVIVPWRMWQAYGDKKFLTESYDSMKRYLDFTDRNFETSYSKVGYADWLCPNWENTDQSVIATSYMVLCSDILAKTAKELGDSEGERKYAGMGQKYRKMFAERYLSADGTVKGDTQTAYLCALAFDVLDVQARGKSFEKLLKAIERSDYHLRTGFVGTPLLLETLSRFGRDDVAEKIFFKQTYPSWLYSVNQGATTMWERWNSYSHDGGFGDVGMNSFNHYAYGAVGKWMYAKLAGLAMDESAPGWRKIIFAPSMSGELTFASATHETPNGLAKSAWRLSDGVVEWNLEIPPNSSGKVVVPTSNLRSIRLDGNTVDKSRFKMEGKYPSIELGSGKYNILFRKK